VRLGRWHRISAQSGDPNHRKTPGLSVEVASAGGVAVRDTTDREGVTLAFSTEAWQQFTRRLLS
jgi:hypothetical protein